MATAVIDRLRGRNARPPELAADGFTAPTDDAIEETAEEEGDSAGNTETELSDEAFDNDYRDLFGEAGEDSGVTASEDVSGEDLELSDPTFEDDFDFSFDDIAEEPAGTELDTVTADDGTTVDADSVRCVPPQFMPYGVTTALERGATADNPNGFNAVGDPVTYSVEVAGQGSVEFTTEPNVTGRACDPFDVDSPLYVENVCTGGVWEEGSPWAGQPAELVCRPGAYNRLLGTYAEVFGSDLEQLEGAADAPVFAAISHSCQPPTGYNWTIVETSQCATGAIAATSSGNPDIQFEAAFWAYPHRPAAQAARAADDSGQTPDTTQLMLHRYTRCLPTMAIEAYESCCTESLACKETPGCEDLLIAAATECAADGDNQVASPEEMQACLTTAAEGLPDPEAALQAAQAQFTCVLDVAVD